MSSLLPLIVLSIALLHSAQVAARKCLEGQEVYSSTGERVKSTLQEEDCQTIACLISLQRHTQEGHKSSLYYGCADEPPSSVVDQFKCMPNGFEVRCFCNESSICNSLDLMFDENGNEAQKHRTNMARNIGLTPQRVEGAGKVSFEWLYFKCQKWTVTYTVTDDKFEEKEIAMQEVEGCADNQCVISISSDSGAKTMSIKSGCSTQYRSMQGKRYLHEEKDHSIDVYCIANTDNPCNTLDLMFDPKGDGEHQARVTALKTNTGLDVFSSTDTNGKRKVDFKWSNCMKWAFEQPLNGPKVEQVPFSKSVPCASGVCFVRVTRMDQDKKITVTAECEPVNPNPIPALTAAKCEIIQGEQTINCRCPAEKEPCNAISAIYKPVSPDQKARFHSLQQIGITATFDSAGEGKFEYDEDFGKTTTLSPITAPRETTVSSRPPIDDDAHRMEGAATGLSIAFAVILPIFRFM